MICINMSNYMGLEFVKVYLSSVMNCLVGYILVNIEWNLLYLEYIIII